MRQAVGPGSLGLPNISKSHIKVAVKNKLPTIEDFPGKGEKLIRFMDAWLWGAILCPQCGLLAKRGQIMTAAAFRLASNPSPKWCGNWKQLMVGNLLPDVSTWQSISREGNFSQDSYQNTNPLNPIMHSSISYYLYMISHFLKNKNYRSSVPRVLLLLARYFLKIFRLLTAGGFPGRQCSNADRPLKEKIIYHYLLRGPCLILGLTLEKWK